jgi:hypothetical protein
VLRDVSGLARSARNSPERGEGDDEMKKPKEKTKYFTITGECPVCHRGFRIETTTACVMPGDVHCRHFLSVQFLANGNLVVFFNIPTAVAGTVTIEEK